MQIQSLNCPNCGAPLHIEAGQALAICVYCDSNIRISYSQDAPAQASKESTLAPEAISRIKQLLRSGKRGEAVQLYQTETHASPPEAEKAIQVFAQQIVFGVMQEQQLSPLGVVLSLLFITLLVGSAIAGLTGAIHPVLALVLVGASVFLLWPFPRSIRTTLEFLRARSAPAVVLKVVPMGEARGVHTFRVLLEVRSPDGGAFQTEINLPVREKNLSKLHTDTVIQVKYLPGDTRRVIFDKALS